MSMTNADIQNFFMRFDDLIRKIDRLLAVNEKILTALSTPPAAAVMEEKKRTMSHEETVAYINERWGDVLKKLARE